MPEGLIAGFEREMFKIYDEAGRRFGYNANYYLRMLEDRGALETAQRLVSEPRHSEGLTFLWEKKALGLSVEALVLREPWNKLFSRKIHEAARRKLRELGYDEPGLGL
jgi:hypothetical protein